MKRAQKVPLGLIVTMERDPKIGPYSHIVARPVTLIDGKVRNPSSGRYDAINGFDRLSGIEVRSQGAEDRRGEGFYAFEVVYRSYSCLDAHEAKQVAATLAKIEKGLRKLYETRGGVKTIGEYIGRVAEVIGAKSLLRIPEGYPRGGWSHDEIPYVTMNLGDGIYHADRLAAEWAKPQTVA